jgi:hypothetical protein
VLPPPSVKKGADGFDDIDDFWAASLVPGAAAKTVVATDGFDMDDENESSGRRQPPSRSSSLATTASSAADADDVAGGADEEEEDINFENDFDDFDDGGGGGGDFDDDDDDDDNDDDNDDDEADASAAAPSQSRQRQRSPVRQHHKRPPGRAKKGMAWDYESGMWKRKGTSVMDTAPRNQTRPARVRHTSSIERPDASGSGASSSSAAEEKKKRRISWAAGTPGGSDDERDAVTPAPRRRVKAKKRAKPARVNTSGNRRSTRQRVAPLAWWANERIAVTYDMDLVADVEIERSGVPTPLIPKAQRRKWAAAPGTPAATTKRKRKGKQAARGAKTAKAQKRAARRVVDSSSDESESEEEARALPKARAKSAKRVATTSTSSMTEGKEWRWWREGREGKALVTTPRYTHTRCRAWDIPHQSLLLLSPTPLSLIFYLPSLPYAVHRD